MENRELMRGAVELTAPREGVNDDVVRVVEWHVADGASVSAEQIAVTIETTKATIDLAAGANGFLFRAAHAGSEVGVGGCLAIIAPSAQRPATTGAHADQTKDAVQAVVTAKARPLLRQHGLSASDFPGLAVIRAEDVERLLACRDSSKDDAVARQFAGQPLDPAIDWDEVLRRADAEQLGALLTALRRRMKARYDRHVPTGTLLHDRWQLARDHGFGEGTSVYDECLILGNVKVGKHCWIGPFTVLDGQGNLSIGDHVDIGTGAHIYSHNTIARALSGHAAPLYRQATTIGSCCFIAPHAVIGPGTRIGDHSFVAAGSYVEGTFPSHSLISGNPARLTGRTIVRGNNVQLQRDTCDHSAVETSASSKSV